MIISIPFNKLLANYRHVEVDLNSFNLTLKNFIELSISVLDRVEVVKPDQRFRDPTCQLNLVTPLSAIESEIQRINPTHCYEDMDAAIFHHQLTALALEVYFELVSSMRIYKITEHPTLSRRVVGWNGQNVLVRVCHIA